MVALSIPDLGEGVEQGTVVRVLVAAGSTVAQDDILFEVETDKVTLEIPAPGAGVIEAWSIDAGSVVRPAEVIGQWSPASGVASELPVPVPIPIPALTAAPPVAPTPADLSPAAGPAAARPVLAAGPAARREARELGVALHAVAATANEAPITRESVREHVRRRLQTTASAAPTPVANTLESLPDLSVFGPLSRLPQSGIERATARNLSRAASVIPHAWCTRSVDIAALEGARREYRQGQAADLAPLTLTVILCKALAVTLAQFPRFNAVYDGATHTIICRDYINLGVAVDTAQGLLVPVLRDVGVRSLRELAQALAQVSAQARAGDASVLARNAAGMTLSNLGGLGVANLQPIINWPEVAILGVGALDRRWAAGVDSASAAAWLPLTLGFDHRVINGADAARFLACLAGLLASPMQLLVHL